MGFQSALAAIDHAANGSVSKSMVMAHARAGCRSASAGLHGSAQGSPAHAGGEQRGNGQDGQKSNGNAHVFCLEAQGHIVPDFGLRRVPWRQGVFVGAKGSSNLPPRAQRCIWAGQIAALAGFDAIVLIGTSEENLRGLASITLTSAVDQLGVIAAS